MRAHLGLCLTLVAAQLSCSAPPPPREKTPAPVASDASSQVVATDPLLSPVPMPAGIVASARLSNLTATARKLAALTGLPAAAVDQGARGIFVELLGRRGARLEVDSAALASVLKLDAPVDLLVAMAEGDRPEPMVLVSIPLTSLEEARSAVGDAAVPSGPGVYALRGKRQRASCALMRSAGPAGGRLVCGGSDRDLEVLAPYATRTLAGEPPTASDLSANIDVAAIDAKFGTELRSILPSLPTLMARRYGSGLLGRAIGDGGRLLGEEVGRLLGDLDQVGMELTVTDGVVLDMSTSFRAKTSFIAKSTFAQPPAAAPALFWKGPKDAASGAFTTMADPAGYADLTSAGKALLVAALADADVGTEAERKKVAALLDFPIRQGTVFVTHAGSGRLSPAPAPKTAKDKWQRAFSQLSGWSMTSTNDKPEAIVRWLKSAVDGYNSPGIQKAMREMFGKEVTVAVKNGRAPAKLGKGAHLVELRIQSKMDKSDATMFLVVAPTPDGTAVASGFELDDLTERLAQFAAGGGELGSRGELAPLKSDPASTGYFFSTMSFKSMVMPWFLMRAPSDPANAEDQMLGATSQAEALFGGLPSKGLAPMFLRTTSNIGTAKAQFTLSLPKPALAEVSELVKKLSR